MARKSRKQQDDIICIPHRTYQTAIYVRLSRDAQKTETIESQIAEVKRFMNGKPEFRLAEIYEDNGYTGRNFHRPAFERLMEDVRNRKIDCIIVKDLSRFAREHIGAEDYLNNIFPFLGVRFISVNDNYDNIHIEPQEYFLASFKLLAHAYFAQETSRKVRMTKRTLQEQGKFVGSKTSFGYRRDPQDGHKLLIDEQQAAVVREIFTRTAAGEKTNDICKALNQKEKSGYIWKKDRVYSILKNEMYIGTLIQRQRMVEADRLRRVPKDKQIRIRNAVPPIVTMELWNSAQSALADRRCRRKGADAT